MRADRAQFVTCSFCWDCLILHVRMCNLKILSDVDDGLVPTVIERAVLRVSREFVGLSSVNHGSFS